MVEQTSTNVTYSGDGVTTEFSITFEFQDAGTIHVAIYDEETNSTTELESDFYVDSVDNKVLYPGYAPGEEPAQSEQPAVLAEGERIVIWRETEQTQETDLGDRYPLPYIEAMVDKTVHMVQELKEDSDRSVKVPRGSDVNPDNLIESISESVVAAAASASAAATSETNAGNSEDAAEQSAGDAADSAEAAADSLREAREIASVIGVVGVPYNDADTYNPPDIVITSDGSSWRCIATSTGEYPSTSSKWVSIALAINDTFEYDDNGDVQPREYATSSGRWTIDSNEDIYPAATI